jgi:hypothetical protein
MPLAVREYFVYFPGYGRILQLIRQGSMLNAEGCEENVHLNLLRETTGQMTILIDSATPLIKLQFPSEH